MDGFFGLRKLFCTWLNGPSYLVAVISFKRKNPMNEVRIRHLVRHGHLQIAERQCRGGFGWPVLVALAL